jgi:hypothetical protein
VVGTAVVPDPLVAVAVVVVGTGRVVEESTRAGPGPPQPARVAASRTAAATLEHPAGTEHLACVVRAFARAAIVAAMMRLGAAARDAPAGRRPAAAVEIRPQ